MLYTHFNWILDEHFYVKKVYEFMIGSSETHFEVCRQISHENNIFKLCRHYAKLNEFDGNLMTILRQGVSAVSVLIAGSRF